MRAGRDLHLGRRVAVKLLRRDMAEQPSVRQRFVAEARAAARLVHPNVVAVFDAGEEDGLPFIVMECLPGRSLADDIAAGPIDPERVRRIAAEALAALQAAHDAGVVHRDIKPANLLLDDKDAVKVADFGIAKITEGLDLTTTGMLVGTPAYLAPERLAGHPGSSQSDLYSLGVVLYEALTATKPFVGDTPLALVHAIDQGRPSPLVQARPDLDPKLAAAVERAMEKDADRRFRTAADMARAVLGDQPGGPGTSPTASSPTASSPTVAFPRGPTTTLERPPRGEPALRWASRHLTTIAVVAAAVLLVVVVGVGLGSRDDSEAPSPTTGNRAPAAPGTLPPPLARALDGLEESIRP
ncbi:MAG: protein kinase [Actinomycetota bacterium]|nr:protein kinase [Actinomycetota bacterium]